MRLQHAAQRLHEPLYRTQLGQYLPPVLQLRLQVQLLPEETQHSPVPLDGREVEPQRREVHVSRRRRAVRIIRDDFPIWREVST
jgi:hypothetical protein